MKRRPAWLNVNLVLWVVYIALLGTLLPHTAWAFGRFEPDTDLGRGIAVLAASSFELAIAALTYRLKQNIERVPSYRTGFAGGAVRRWSERYLNVYTLGLLVAIAVSSAANWAHAVQFGQGLAVFGDYGVPPVVYSVGFGGILPLCSLLFARILADVRPTAAEADPELTKAKTDLAEVRKQLRQAEADRQAAEARARDAETRFAAAGDIFARLLAAEKRTRILAARERWPELLPGAIAVIAGASPSYVSEVLADVSGNRSDPRS